MYLNLQDFKDTGIDIKGIIHVGMHEAEEYKLYKDLGIPHICFVEANIELCNKVANSYIGTDPKVKIINSAILDKSGVDVELNVTNNFQSSSLLQLKDHKKVYPHIVNTGSIKMKSGTLDQVMKLYNPEDINFLNLDIQGVELQAMKGLSNWDHIDIVYTEVNYREMYAGCALEKEVTDYLRFKGLTKVREIDTGCGWGDALYVRQ